MSKSNVALLDVQGRSTTVSPSEEGFRVTLEDSLVPLTILDANFRPLLFSRGWAAEALPTGVVEIDGRARLALGDGFVEASQRCLEMGAVETRQIEVSSCDGFPARWFKFECTPFPAKGGVYRVIVSARDVTETVAALREAEEARRLLAEQNARFGAALGNMPHGLCMFDAGRRMILCNAAYGELYGLPEAFMRPGVAMDDILARRRVGGTAPRDEAEFCASPRQIARGGGVQDVALTDGRTIRITRTPIETGGYVATHEDVTDGVRAAARIEFLAFRDPLTGLPNRAAFQRAYDEAIMAAEAGGEAFGLIMVDVDHFKDINDTLGHDAGDALLKALADKLKSAFRHGDTVARLGGDEFAIVLRDLRGENDLTRPIAVLQDLLRAPIEHAGQSFTICASIGAAGLVDRDDDPNHLLKNADVALYQAKYDGRNRSVVFRPAMRTDVEQRVELLREVRLAIAQGEFEMFYQPVVDLAANAVAGFEALMRWNHPEQGLLPPAAFMAAFEDNDLSLQLGEVAFDRSLSQMRAWLDEGVDFGRVAINISSAQFRTGRLAAEIADRLVRSNVPAERLTIEVTEHVYMGWGAEVVADTVRRLHASGVQIALDDFGTGYASLANLRQFPVDRLKIDKSFVQNDGDDAIVRAVINLGSSMGMKVVAEGVERPDQLAALTQYGCDQVQGYHFARPMPAGEVADFISGFMARG